jgi:hypothetical protein
MRKLPLILPSLFLFCSAMGHVPQVSQQRASLWEARAVRLGKPPLWFITKDSDFGTVHAGKMILNAAPRRPGSLLTLPDFERAAYVVTDRLANRCVMRRRAHSFSTACRIKPASLQRPSNYRRAKASVLRRLRTVSAEHDAPN